MFELLLKAGSHYHIFNILIIIHTEREAINVGHLKIYIDLIIQASKHHTGVDR